MLLALMLPMIVSCDKTDDASSAKDDSPADVTDEIKDAGNDVKDNEDDKGNGVAEPEPTPEPKPEPGADVPAGGTLKKYDFADGLQGFEPDDGKLSDSGISVAEINGVKVLALNFKFDGWSGALAKFPNADAPLISKASKAKYDVYFPVADIDALSWVSFAPARATEWGKWWEGWDLDLNQIKKAAEKVGDYYKITHEFDFTIEMNGEWIPLSEWGGAIEMYLGVVFNGFTTTGDLPVCINNIEFIK